MQDRRLHAAEIVRLAGQKPQDSRSRWIQERCAGDQELLHEVLSLLTDYPPAAGLPGSPVAPQGRNRPTTDPPEGRKLGSYRLSSMLGEGGMGQVYLGQDVRLGRTVAVKILPPGFTSDPRRRDRFLQEARTASALNHPNIVTVHDIGTEDGLDFLVMEHIEGNPLNRLIPPEGMPVGQVLRIAVAIADALDKAHTAGIVHRDLKPGNIMLTLDGRPKILDFGLAKLIETSPGKESDVTHTLISQYTQEGSIIGTVGYMSPEQAEGRPVEIRSDIFSLGSVLYEMLTGKQAFTGATCLATLAAILREDPKPVGAIVTGIPKTLESIVARCLQKDPEKRFPSMAELRNALEELRREFESGILFLPERKMRFRIGIFFAAAAAGAALLAALGGAWYFSSNSDRLSPSARVVPLTTLPGMERTPGLSPDGKMVSFSWSGPSGDNFDIYLLQVGTNHPLRRTTAPEVDTAPKWSPDGQQILFARGSPWQWDFFLMPALGGPERKVADSRSPIGSASWTPDGRSILITDRFKEGRNGIWLVALDTGERRPLTPPPPKGSNDLFGTISSPDSPLRFWRMSGLSTGDLFELPLGPQYQSQGEVRPITRFNGLVRGSAESPDGGSTVVSMDYEGTSGLWRIRPDGTPPEQIPLAVDGIGSIAAAPHVNRLVLERETVDSNIWCLDLQAGAPPKPLIVSSRRDWNAFWSPDGRKIAFFSDRSGRIEIWLAGADGSEARSLTQGELSAKGRLVGWFPDSHRIVYTAPDQGQQHLWAVDTDSGRRSMMLGDLRFPSGNVSPGAGEVIYFSRSTGDGWNLFRIDGKTGSKEAVQITSRGGTGAMESPDGKFLYYGKRHDTGLERQSSSNSLWRMPLGGTESQAEEVLPEILSVFCVAVSEQGVYYLAPAQGGKYPICFFDSATRRIQPVHTLDKPPASGLSLSPDGRRLLFSQIDLAGSDLLLVENFR